MTYIAGPLEPDLLEQDHAMQYFQRFSSIVGLLATMLVGPVDVFGAGDSSAVTTMQDWKHASRGRSTNAALAFYRQQRLNPSRSRSQYRSWRPDRSSSTIYSAPYYAITAHRTIPNFSSNPYPIRRIESHAAYPIKPFANARPAPTAVDRYWPLLLEAREDPKTGLVIWRLP
jgi:hypothetical protein